MSDESEYEAEPEEFDIYKTKYQLLLDKCETLQQVRTILIVYPDFTKPFISSITSIIYILLFYDAFQDNERLVYRIQRVRKLLKQTRKEKKYVT